MSVMIPQSVVVNGATGFEETREPEPQSEVTVIASMEGYSKNKRHSDCELNSQPYSVAGWGLQGLVFSKPVCTLSLSLHSHLLKITAHIL